jgi:hypothetical protein
MESDLPARLLAEARRCAPAPVACSRLVPFRETLLTLQAKRISQEKIAKFLKQHGVQIERTAVGDFCRRFCPAADIERVRRDLIAAATGTLDSTPFPTAAKPSPDNGSGKRRNPRIARDDL